MKISSIEIFRAPIPLKKPFVISLGTLRSADNIFVRVSTDEGITGYGECSPFASINGETAEGCLVYGRILAARLIGADPCNHEECALIMDRILFGNSSIKSALSMATYDIAARKENLPLFRYLGGANDKDIVTDFTVSLGDPQTMAADADNCVTEGYGIIKVKLGESGSNDIKRTMAVREAVGDSVILRIDANQGWRREEAVETLNAVYDYNIQFCEEPIARWDFMRLRQVSEKSRVAVMADESCCDHHDAERLAELGACPHFNIKLGKSSGILYAMKIAAIAAGKDILLQAGGFLETRLGFSATAHVALACKNIIWFDFDSPLFMTIDPIAGGMEYGKEGRVTVPDKPGIGAEPDERYLARLTKITVS